MRNNEKIDSEISKLYDLFDNSSMLSQAIREDKEGNKGRMSTESTYYVYSNFEEYFSYLCMRRFIAEGFKVVGEDGWCYSGYNNNQKDYYKIYFRKYMDDGYEAIEFYISQFEFDKVFPNTYPTIIPLILREDGSYIPANTINEAIYRVYFTDDRGIVHEDGCDIYNNHFHKGTYNDENWYRIVNSNMYEPV